MTTPIEGTTPRPWHSGGEWSGDHGGNAIYDDRAIYIAWTQSGVGGDWIDGNNPLGPEVARANAALIVAAVNDYDRLRAIEDAARAVLPFLDDRMIPAARRLRNLINGVSEADPDQDRPAGDLTEGY